MMCPRVHYAFVEDVRDAVRSIRRFYRRMAQGEHFPWGFNSIGKLLNKIPRIGVPGGVPFDLVNEVRNMPGDYLFRRAIGKRLPVNLSCILRFNHAEIRNLIATAGSTTAGRSAPPVRGEKG